MDVFAFSNLKHVGGTLGGEGFCDRNDRRQDGHQDPVHHTCHHRHVVPGREREGAGIIKICCIY